MIALIENMSAQRGREMREHAASHRLAARFRRERPRTERVTTSAEQLMIRRIDPVGADRDALERVSGRDSAQAPSGDVMGAERDGQLIAALSLTTGEAVSDPFVPAAEARAALLQRADRLHRDTRLAGAHRGGRELGRA